MRIDRGRGFKTVPAWNRPWAAYIVIVSSLLQLLGCRPALPEAIQSHSLAYHRLNSDRTDIVSSKLSASSDTSIIVTSVGRGSLTAFTPPTDEAGNALLQLGEVHAYTKWKNSGTALYMHTYGEPFRGLTVHNTTPGDDEITLAAVAISGTRVQDFVWNEVLRGNAITSQSVHTTGPATLVAFWWGDAGVKGWKRAMPNNRFRVINSVLASGALVQCAVAVKYVAEPGEYNVTWTAKPSQGAQLWLVAVQ
jgi:hypothetical protein